MAAKAAGRTLLDACRIELASTPITFVALSPGFTYTEGLDDTEVPIKALIIQKERAVREMVWAMEQGKSHHVFPKRIAILITLARWLPEPLRRRVLAASAQVASVLVMSIRSICRFEPFTRSLTS